MQTDRRHLGVRLARRRPGGRYPSFDTLERRALLAGPGLTVALASHDIAGNAGAAVTIGTVTRSATDNSLPLTVSLTSSNAAAVALPATVTIPAGQASATFNVATPVGGTPSGGKQTVTVTGTATAEATLATDTSFKFSVQGFTTSALAAQPDGKIVAVGTYATGITKTPAQMAVIRYNADGSLDTTFHGGTMVTIGVPTESWQAQAVTVRPLDGTIYVAGVSYDPTTPGKRYAVATVSATGTVQNSVTLPFYSGETWGLAVQPDGSLLLGGDTNSYTSTADDFSAMRFNTYGALDPTFGGGTVPAVSLSPGSDIGYALLLQPDGKVIVAGTSNVGSSTSHFAAIRFTSAGVLDPTFGTGGIVQTALPGSFEQAHAAALQPDGKIILAGSVSPAGATASAANDFALIRYNTDGTLDPTFGTNGMVIRDFGGDDRISSLAVEPDGIIVAAGMGGSAASPTTILARFLPDGSLGTAIVNSGNTGIQALTLQPGGRLIVAFGSPAAVNVGVVAAYAGTAALTASDSLTVGVNHPPRRRQRHVRGR